MALFFSDCDSLASDNLSFELRHSDMHSCLVCFLQKIGCKNSNNKLKRNNIMYSRNFWFPEVFNDFFDNNNMAPARATAPAINVLETPSGYRVELAAPGMRKEDFDININQDGNLTIKMENHRKQEEEKSHYLRREFSYTTYEQTLILPDEVDKNKISARVSDGVLTVSLPKIQAEEQKVARQIGIE